MLQKENPYLLTSCFGVFFKINKYSPVAPIIPKLTMSPATPPDSQKPDTLLEPIV